MKTFEVKLPPIGDDTSYSTVDTVRQMNYLYFFKPDTKYCVYFDKPNSNGDMFGKCADFIIMDDLIDD